MTAPRRCGFAYGLGAVLLDSTLDQRGQRTAGSRALRIAGDSCGGNIAAAITLLAKQCGDVSFAAQVLFEHRCG